MIALFSLFLLFLWPVLIFILINLILLPFHFTLRSIFSLITIPFEIFNIAVNKKLRQNHALEHATINVIQEYYGKELLLSGFAKENGFYIRGPIRPELLEEAAKVGLARLNAGDTYLAIHEKCGTSIAMSNFVASVVFLLFLFKLGYFNLFNILVAMVLANMFGPLLGKMTQQFLTTTHDVSDIEIIGIDYNYPQFGVIFPGNMEYFVRTRSLSRIP
ncbi:MAG: hypothetical protein PWP66_143 [Thermosediminibacterales bacterium]|nr:hypothetical protein [Thermosediminibacterales bacterium]